MMEIVSSFLHHLHRENDKEEKLAQLAVVAPPYELRGESGSRSHAPSLEVV